MFIITKKYLFQNSYEAFATLQKAGKSVAYQEMCLRDKLIYFKLKWDNVILDLLTRFGDFLAHCLRVPIDRISSEPLEESSRNFRLVSGIFTFLSFCQVYNLPILTILFEVLLFILAQFYFSSTLALGALFVSFTVLDFFLFPWKSYLKRISQHSTQILCPFG